MTVNGIGAASYSYDATGNMTAKTESSAGMLSPTNMTLVYPAPGQPRPHAVTSTTGTPALTLSYDANGNLATQASSTYAYDAENRLKTRTVTAPVGGTVSYVYDAAGRMVKRLNADGTSTLYVGGVYERNSDGSTVTYYGFAGKTVAMRRTPVSGPATLSYLLGDQVGSTSVVTDSGGAVVASQRYWPYGAARSGGVTQTDKLYTGQQAEPGDGALGLYNYKARFYSTVTGRFVSADGSTKDALNRFAYVTNNPMRYTDPAGLCILDMPRARPGTNDPRGCGITPQPGEDKEGHNFLRDPGCDDVCGALVFLRAISLDPVARERFLRWIGVDPPSPAPPPSPVRISTSGSQTADASPLPVVCGSRCPHERVRVNNPVEIPCIACEAASAAGNVGSAINNIVTSSCFQGVLGAVAISAAIAIVAVTGGLPAYFVLAETGSYVLAGEAAAVAVGTLPWPDSRCLHLSQACS